MNDVESFAARSERSVLDLVYVGFNSRVVALHRDTGEIVWTWKSPEGSGFVATLLDGDRLVASVDGYTYCLDAVTGEALWSNPLKGMGIGTPSLTSIYGNSGSAAAAALIARQQQASTT
ncbi:MAG: PQQ-binding-like beta-propeller repeat protein [Planctomycetaceae bacterium]